jgi:hypothetical protein
VQGAASGSCRACAPDHIAAKPGSAQCQVCPAGFATRGSGRTQCWKQRATTPRPTPAPKRSTTAPPTKSSPIAQQNCPLGKFERGAVCTSCSPGKFQARRKRTYCDSCPAGKFTHSYAAHTCRRCPAGQHQGRKGTFECKKCAAGRIAPDEASRGCSKCKASTYSADGGQVSCKACAAGKVSAAGASSCSKARATTEPPKRHGPPTPAPSVSPVAKENCPAGKFERTAHDSAHVVCVSCSPGKFQARRKRTYCDSCPVGKFTHSYAAHTCRRCSAGQHQDREGAFECKKCAAGRIAPGTGVGFCTLCATGQFAHSAGQLRCLPCAAGRVAPAAGAARCTKRAATAAPTPVPHPAGPTTAPPTRSPIAQQNCPTGKWERENSEMHGHFFCGSCPPGKFQPRRKRTFCRVCAAGRYTNNYAATACARCPAGQYLAKGAQHKFECAVCQPGRYSSAMGMERCMACDAAARRQYKTCATPAPTPVAHHTRAPAPKPGWLKQQKKWVVQVSSASSSAAHPATSMLDDKIRTAWVVRGATPATHQWAVFDLGSDARLSKVKLYKDTKGGIRYAHLQRAAAARGPWQNVAALSTAQHQRWQQVEVKFAPTTSRFWRLDVSGLWQGTVAADVCELHFFGYLVPTPSYLKGSHARHGKLSKLGAVRDDSMGKMASTWNGSAGKSAVFAVVAVAAVLAALKLSDRFSSRDDGYSQVVAVGEGGAEEQPLGGADIQLDAMAMEATAAAAGVDEGGGGGGTEDGGAAGDGADSPSKANPFSSYRA